MTRQGQRQTGTQRRGQRAAHSWATVDLDAVRHNVRSVKRLLGPKRHFWAVVKANAYGHGAVPVGRAAVDAGADGLAVACLAEAAELRRGGIDAPILHLAAGEARRAGRVVDLDLVQTACAWEMAEALSRAARRRRKTARLHLKVDTGMGRLGVQPEEAGEFARRVSALPGVQLGGVFSHLASAEAAGADYTWEQFRRFEDALDRMRGVGVPPGMRHLANSAAALRFPQMLLDGVRAGLLVYGIRPDAPELAPLDLRPALSWRTRVGFLQRVAAGSPISYGGTYVTDRERSIAVLPVGYADGYPRHASNRAQVLVGGRLCPVVGVVCMDHTMVDVTEAGDVQVGEQAVLVGRQGNEQITANELAAWAGTVVHEIPTAIGTRVARVYTDSTAGSEGERR